MARTQLNDLAIDETLDAAALERVRGGIIAVVPTDQFSLNFNKVQWDMNNLNLDKKIHFMSKH